MKSVALGTAYVSLGRSNMFTKYSSIENHYRDAYVDSLKMQGFTHPDVSWVAREKIHGTNLSALIENGQITWCKRSGPIEPGEGFYNHTIVTKAIEDRLITLSNHFYLKNKVVQVFGELAGAGVMTQVDYGEKDFYIFDILVDNEFLSDGRVQLLCVEFCLKISPVMGRGTFDEMFALNREFESNVMAYSARFKDDSFGSSTKTWLYKQPEGNTAEGLVIKPIIPKYDRFGSRVILKLKSDTFKEKEKATRIKVAIPFSEQDQEALDIMCSYVTQARFDNVMSKGEYTIKQVGMVIGLFAKDALEDIEKDNEFTLDEAKRVSKEFNRIVSELVRENIQKFK